MLTAIHCLFYLLTYLYGALTAMNTYLSLNGKQWDGDTDGCGDSKCNQHTLYLV